MSKDYRSLRIKKQRRIKMAKKIVLITAILLITLGLKIEASAGDYNFISAEDLHKRVAAESSMIIVDILPAEQFAKGHIKGAIETNAYPVKTEAEKARLAEQLPKIMESTDDVVIICPRGSGGAKRTFDFYKENGVAEKRLLILEKGMNGWPYEVE